MIIFLKVVLINRIVTLTMSAKLTTLGLLELKVWGNEGYDVIISVNNVINKIFLHDPNFVVNVVKVWQL